MSREILIRPSSIGNLLEEISGKPPTAVTFETLREQQVYQFRVEAGDDAVRVVEVVTEDGRPTFVRSSRHLSGNRGASPHFLNVTQLLRDREMSMKSIPEIIQAAFDRAQPVPRGSLELRNLRVSKMGSISLL